MIDELFNLPADTLATGGYCGIPTIEYIGNGNLWTAWYEGGDGEKPGNYISYSRSNDYGKNWTSPVPAVIPKNLEIHRAFDPCLWQCPDGRLWLFWGVAKGKLEEMQVFAAYTENPLSAKPVWSAPRSICPGIMMNKPIAVTNGDWLLPVAYWDLLEDNQRDPEMKSSRVWRSTDNGKTFAYHGSADIEKSSCDEHMLVELDPGIIKMFTRTSYGIGESISKDGGKTWSQGQDSGIYNSDSRFYFGRLKSGNLLLVKHAPGSCYDKNVYSEEQQTAYDAWKSRINLTACLSEDNGKTWPHELLIDGRNYVSYPDVTQQNDGTINIIYDRDRYNEQNIIMATLTEEDIKQKIPARLTSIV